jgi:hypothetical protein
MASYKTSLTEDPRKAAFVAWARSLVSFTNPYVEGDDLFGAAWTDSSVTGGSVKRGARSKAKFACTAAAGSTALLSRGVNRSSSNFPLLFPSGATSKFAFEMRFQLTTAVVSTATLAAGDTIEWLVGVRGGSSTTKFVARFSNGPTLMTSTIDIDTNVFHRIRVARDGLLTYLQADNETYVTSLNAYCTNEERFQLQVFDTGNAAREMEVDYAYLMGDAA